MVSQLYAYSYSEDVREITIDSSDTSSISNNINVEELEFESGFQEKYTDKEFVYETVLKETKTSAWERFKRAFRDFLYRLFDFGGSKKSFSGWELFFKIIIYLIILFAIYQIVRLLIKKEGQWIFSKKNKKIIVSEIIEENIHTTNFKSLIEKAKKNKDYRITIRYYYLWLLKTWSNNQIIEWDLEKTNSDYYREIKQEDKRENFKYLSYIYDYIWYGEFEIEENEFLKAEKVFIKNIQG